MNRNSLTIAALAAAIAVTAGCGPKKTADLPPAPMGADGTDPSDPYNTGQVDGADLPGSRAAFLRAVSSDRIYFGTDDSSIDGEDRVTLDSQASWLLQNTAVRVTIEGHADERGTREYNLALGERRANAAKNYLQSRGIAASRLSVVSWGKEQPVALGSDESSWSQNRRSVTVIPQ